jgi:hypothetical protein
MDERWLTRSPKEMLDTFHWYHGEGFNLIIEDLLDLPTDRPVIAEGFRLLPNLVRPLLADVSSAVWLLPTPEFRRAVFDSRDGPAWGFLSKTSEPQQSLQNLLERDAMFTDRLAAKPSCALVSVTSSAMARTCGCALATATAPLESGLLKEVRKAVSDRAGCVRRRDEGHPQGGLAMRGDDPR